MRWGSPVSSIDANLTGPVDIGPAPEYVSADFYPVVASVPQWVTGFDPALIVPPFPSYGVRIYAISATGDAATPANLYIYEDNDSSGGGPHPQPGIRMVFAGYVGKGYSVSQTYPPSGLDLAQKALSLDCSATCGVAVNVVYSFIPITP